MSQDRLDILASIAAYKRDEIRDLRTVSSLGSLRNLALSQKPTRGFANRLIRVSQTRPAIIAEVKKASPSKKLIRPEFDPIYIARNYTKGGAACLSVLTDQPSFQGSLEIFRAVRETTNLPLLRKDFILDPIQVAQSRAIGADAILIILTMVDDKTARRLIEEAKLMGLDVLVETHTAFQIKRAIKLGAKLIGINNRNLGTFETCLETFSDLAGLVPDDVFLVAESGIFTRSNINNLTKSGARAFLIGEALMRQSDVRKATFRLSGCSA